jgi:hypothetical protein
MTAPNHFPLRVESLLQKKGALSEEAGSSKSVRACPRAANAWEEDA